MKLTINSDTDFILHKDGRTQFSSAYAKFTFSFKLFMIWRPFFARVKVNHRRVYSRILVKVGAVAMVPGLVKIKA